MMATDGAGYDYYFVEPPPERSLCNICQLPCRQAHSNEDHEHIYCKPCVTKIGIKSLPSVSNLYYHVLHQMFSSHIVTIMYRWTAM